MAKEIAEKKIRFLDLECMPDFEIQETASTFNSAVSQKAKKILDEMLDDPKVKGEIRKKILKCQQLLDLED